MPEVVTPSVVSDAGRSFLRLALLPDVGPIRARNLIEHFGGIDAIFGASISDLQRVEQIGPRTAESIFRARRDVDAVDREIAAAVRHGVRILCPLDTDFPRPLLNMPDPPICVYIRGTVEPADAVAVAIVGTRRCSHYGHEQAERFAEALAGAGFTVVSGMARGIDGCAHEAALRAGGRTLAVLGNGLAYIYPPEHDGLARRIENAGALVSELPVEASPEAKNFPMRNRLIAGLTLGVIVIEAGKKSGALITARHACEYNREVFALPGRIDRPEVSAGVNGLIRDGGAKLITCLDDVLDELKEVGRIMRRSLETAPNDGAIPSDSVRNSTKDHASNEGSAERAAVHACATSGQGTPTAAEGNAKAPGDADDAMLSAMRDGAETVDAIAESARRGIGEVLGALTRLELAGRIKRLPGDRFELKR